MDLQRRCADCDDAGARAVNRVTTVSTKPLLTPDERKQRVDRLFNGDPRVAESRDRAAETENLENKIMDALDAARRAHPQGALPASLYLGHDEDRVLRRGSMRYQQGMTGNGRTRYLGMAVFVVDAGNHLAFGWDRDDETRRTTGESLDASGFDR
jgi:hypothetical protein